MDREATDRRRMKRQRNIFRAIAKTRGNNIFTPFFFYFFEAKNEKVRNNLDGVIAMFRGCNLPVVKRRRRHEGLSLSAQTHSHRICLFTALFFPRWTILQQD